MVTVFLVDDHEVVRRGLIDLLSADPELDVIGEAGTVSHAMAQIPALRPDVAVLDVRLPDGNGIELCRDLLSRLPDLRCLMLTSFTSDEAMLDAMGNAFLGRRRRLRLGRRRLGWGSTARQPPFMPPSGPPTKR